MTTALEQAELESDEAEASFKAASDALAAADVALTSITPTTTLTPNPAWREANSQVIELERERVKRLEQLTEVHPEVQSLDTRLAEARAGRDGLVEMISTTVPADESAVASKRLERERAAALVAETDRAWAEARRSEAEAVAVEQQAADRLASLEKQLHDAQSTSTSAELAVTTPTNRHLAWLASLAVVAGMVAGAGNRRCQLPLKNSEEVAALPIPVLAVIGSHLAARQRISVAIASYRAGLVLCELAVLGFVLGCAAMLAGGLMLL